MTDTATDDRLLLMPEVAQITRRSLDTLRYWRATGDGPPSFRLGKRVVYPESGLRAWIRQQAEQDGASERGENTPSAPRSAIPVRQSRSRGRRSPSRKPHPAA